MCICIPFRDGTEFDGERIRVEFGGGGGGGGRGRGRGRYDRYYDDRGGRDYYDRYDRGGYRRGGGGAARRTDYQLIVTGLPSTAR